MVIFLCICAIRIEGKESFKQKTSLWACVYESCLMAVVTNSPIAKCVLRARAGAALFCLPVQKKRVGAAPT